jgi:guanylate kinase
MKKGQLFIVSAPSGAGKSSLINALLSRFNGDDSLRLSISHTTREPRPGEVNHMAYHFVSEDEFKALIARGAFYEYANVFGHYYGTSREIVEQWVSEGKDVLFDIDWQGARQIRKISPEARSIFIIPPSLEELRHRLESRGQDSEEVIKGRMDKALREISHFSEYDHVIINDDFDTALNELRSIILAARDEEALKAPEVEALFPQAAVPKE